MNSLVPLNYHGFPTVQYPSSYQTQPQYYPDQLGMQSTYLSPAGNHSYYGQHLNSINGYPVNELKRKDKGSYGEQFINLINKLDGQYRQERYSRLQDKLERRYWRDQVNRLPPPMYPAGQTAGYYHTEGPAYHYEQEIRYVPFPVYITANTPSGRGIRTTLPGEIAPVPFTGGFTTTTFLGGGNTMALPPKIRVIFIPTGSSPMQQPCMGPLTMPPFLFNRMAQPLCSFPLPPPLPQVGSLPLTPGIQEMVMQRYVNPIAVLPYTPTYQMPQAMAPLYPSMPQAAPALPYSGYQPVQSVAQSYMPALPAPQMPMMPALPPPPLPILAAPPMAQPPPPQPQAFQAGYSAPMVQSFPQASQGYAPQQAPTGNYSTVGYSNPCRACPPAPPSLNIPVTGHCWVQHCSACHHVPMPIDHPNVRPSNGRVTPLLRHPTVPQYTPDQSMINQTIHPPELMRPWLRKTPPLPPGAVLISDEYLDAGRDHKHRNHRSATRTKDEVRVPRQKERSATVTSATVTNSILGRNTQSKSPMTPRVTMDSRSNLKPLKPVEPFRVRHASSISSSTGSETSQELIKYEKVVLPQTEKKENSIPKELAAEARNVNLRYNYPAQELPSVYLNNRYIKSSSEGSSLSSNTARQSPSSSVSSKITMDETSSLKEKEKVKGLPPLPPLPPKPPKARIVVREYVTTSPSTISSNSSILSDIAFSIIGSRKDSDSISTTSTIKATRLPYENKHKSKS